MVHFPFGRAVAGVVMMTGLWLPSATPLQAQTAIDMTIKDHRFTPSEIHVPAVKPAVLNIKNEDATAEEFDSSALKIEKVIGGANEGTVRLGHSIPAATRSWANTTPTRLRASSSLNRSRCLPRS